MSFRIREIAGWLMLGIALYLVRLALQYVDSRQVIEAGVIVMASGLLFRCGTYLIRLSTAARICMQTRDANRDPS